MDFDSEFTSDFSGNNHVKKDHSPNKIPTHDDILSSATKISNSADDFEHIGSKIDSEFDLLDGGFNRAFKSNETADDLLGDFKANKDFPPPLKSDNVDAFDSFNKAKESTMDFMAAERSHIPRMNASPPAPPVQAEVPSAPMKASIYDDLENDYLNPYASTKNNEKFISSEDLLSDFKEVAAEARSNTPDFFKEPVESFHSEPKETVIQAQPIIPKPIQVTPPAPKPVEIKQEVSHSKVEEIPEVKKAVKPKQKEEMISAEEMFYKIGLGELIFKLLHR